MPCYWLPGRRGRGLVTTQDAEPGEVLLSVPFTHAFIEEDAVDAGQPWSCGMALRLLRILGEPEVGEEGGALLRPWAESLPTRCVRFPPPTLPGSVGSHAMRSIGAPSWVKLLPAGRLAFPTPCSPSLRLRRLMPALNITCMRNIAPWWLAGSTRRPSSSATWSWRDAR